MIIIVDANIIISAMINPYSNIVKILLSEWKSIDFLIPEYAIQETLTQKHKLANEFNISDNLFESFIKHLNDVALIYSQEFISDKDFAKANEIVEKIDPKDAIYVAFSLALDALIWTGDLKLFKALRRK
jgi:predicted nucleic acid-binding protein